MTFHLWITLFVFGLLDIYNHYIASTIFGTQLAKNASNIALLSYRSFLYWQGKTLAACTGKNGLISRCKLKKNKQHVTVRVKTRYFRQFVGNFLQNNRRGYSAINLAILQHRKGNWLHCL